MINDSLRAAWRRGWLTYPELDPAVLMTAARNRTGLGDFGPDEGWLQRLGLLTEELQQDDNLTPLGRVIAYGQFVAALANRARMHALWRTYPEILERPMPAPIIVLGQMRSGTTRMQRLLACDDRMAHTRFFESWNPIPASPRRSRVDDRRLRGWIALRFIRWLNPTFDAIHPTGILQPDEEIGFHSVSIFGSAFEAQWRVPAFVAHCEQIDTRPVYAEFKRILQTVAWMRREPENRPWILKVPQMMQDLPAVLDIFPDARLIGLHRDPADVVASSASLVRNQMSLQYEALDPKWIGQEWVRKVALRDTRARQARAAFEGPQIDVNFDETSVDWRSTMHRIYDMLDLPLSAPVQEKMAGFMDAKHSSRPHKHHYTPEEFGLAPAQAGSPSPA